MVTGRLRNPMTTLTDRETGPRDDDGVVMTDPRAPRFGQAITTAGLLAGIALDAPALVFTIAAILGLAVVSRWRLDGYGLLWRRAIQPVIGSATDPEPAAPHRFAKLLGAVGTALASVTILVGVPTLGYVIAGGVAVAAGLAATTGLCLGCNLYRQVGFFRRRDVI